MTEYQKKYNERKISYETYKEKCNIYKPSEVLNRMYTSLYFTCSMPYRIMRKRTRIATEFFDYLERDVLKTRFKTDAENEAWLKIKEGR
jgi:hypothetical protein